MKRIILYVVGLCLLGYSPGWAAVTANSIITAQTPNNFKQNFVQGTDAAGTFKTYYTAGANGSKCNAVMIATNDGTAQHVMTLEIVNGGTSYPICTFTTALAPTNPPNNTYSATNEIGTTNCAGLPVDSDGNPYLQLINGDVLKGTFATALTSGDQIIAYPICADF